jgi:hypothetical protein
MKTRVAPLLVVAGLALAPALFAAEAVKLTPSDDRIRVELGGQLFTEYIFKGGARPYLYPVHAADGTKLNRDFPQVKGVAGEEEDHPHHTSLFFTHGAVNGIDFWTVGARKGTIVNDSVKSEVKGDTGVIVSRNRWLAGDGVAVVCTDETTLRFKAVPGGRALDYEVTIKAQPDKELVFGDTKEGSMAIRLAQWLTAPHKFKGKDGETKGQIVNDSGARQGATWGKKSTWVDYHAEKDGKTYGVAMFDHPKNPRHPTWWHVRDYGLFAANPFGQHDFESNKENPKIGDLTVPAGGSVTFRWRFYFHEGDEKSGKVAERFKDYAAGK